MPFPGLIDTDLPGHFRKAASMGVPFKTRNVQYDEGGIKGVFEVNAFQAGLDRMVGHVSGCHRSH